jgi:hypothetical protein
MDFLLNLAFSSGRRMADVVIADTDPLRGSLIVRDWPPRGIKREVWYRRAAVFSFRDKGAQGELWLFDPQLRRATDVYLELTGVEQVERQYFVQSWILRLAPAGASCGFDPKDDDRD